MQKSKISPIKLKDHYLKFDDFYQLMVLNHP